MKLASTLPLFAIAVVSQLLTSYASAQIDNLVEIRNDSEENRKICIYKDGDAAGLVPYRCYTMKEKERVVWNRGDATAHFNIKVFRPLLVDKLLVYRRLPGRTNIVVMGLGDKLRYSEFEVKATVPKYRLKVCNERFNETIFFSLSFETNEQVLTEGWWSVLQGQCHEFAVSERLRRSLKTEYGFMPRIYYYAQTFVANPMYWTGGADGLPLCVLDGKKFMFKQRRGVARNAVPGACDPNGQRRVSFRPIDAPKVDQAYFYITF